VVVADACLGVFSLAGKKKGGLMTGGFEGGKGPGGMVFAVIGLIWEADADAVRRYLHDA
jgi:hypothetical protein